MAKKQRVKNRCRFVDSKGLQRLVGIVAVGAVWSEPVSGPISLFYRENTGNFVDSASNRRDRSLLTH